MGNVLRPGQKKPVDRNHPTVVRNREMLNSQCNYSETLKAQSDFWENSKAWTNEQAEREAAAADVVSDELQNFALETRRMIESPLYRGECSGGTQSAESMTLRKEVQRRLSILYPGEVHIDRVPSNGRSLHGDGLTGDEFNELQGGEDQ